MIRSMTGYGKGTAENQGILVTAEIKAINHRFLDLKLHLDREMVFLGNTIRNHIAEQVKRGHLDVTILVKQSSITNQYLEYDKKQALQLKKYIEQLEIDCALKQPLAWEKLITDFNIIKESKKNSSEISQPLLTELTKQALTVTLQNLTSMRQQEGSKTRDQLNKHLINIKSFIADLEPLLPLELDSFKDRLKSRITELISPQAPLDEERIAHEVAILAEKKDVTEETTRLQSHLYQLDRWINGDNPQGIGKKLDFLLQEINREINTIGSKSSQLETSKVIIELKSETEMIREQVQNIE